VRNAQSCDVHTPPLRVLSDDDIEPQSH
jgi:hypothetical protein